MIKTIIRASCTCDTCKREVEAITFPITWKHIEIFDNHHDRVEKYDLCDECATYVIEAVKELRKT